MERDSLFLFKFVRWIGLNCPKLFWLIAGQESFWTLCIALQSQFVHNFFRLLEKNLFIVRTMSYVCWCTQQIANIKCASNNLQIYCSDSNVKLIIILLNLVIWTSVHVFMYLPCNTNHLLILVTLSLRISTKYCLLGNVQERDGRFEIPVYPRSRYPR